MHEAFTVRLPCGVATLRRLFTADEKSSEMLEQSLVLSGRSRSMRLRSAVYRKDGGLLLCSYFQILHVDDIAVAM